MFKFSYLIVHTKTFSKIVCTENNNIILIQDDLSIYISNQYLRAISSCNQHLQYNFHRTKQCAITKRSQNSILIQNTTESIMRPPFFTYLNIGLSNCNIRYIFWLQKYEISCLENTYRYICKCQFSKVGYRSAPVGFRRSAVFVTGKADGGNRQVTDAESIIMMDPQETQVLNINLAVTCSLLPVVVRRLLLLSFLSTVIF